MARLIAPLTRVLVCLSLVLGASVARAQTLGTLSGTVADQSGAVLPGAGVIAVHIPTGTAYETVSNPIGFYAIPNVRVGGPYRVTANLSGFKEQTKDGIFVKLGDEAYTSFKLEVQAVTESVTVTAEANPIINPGRTGAASNVNSEVIERLPSVGRGFNDFARLNPHFQTDAGRGGLVVSGKNYRYNSIQIDGAVTNDLFGLSSSGAPGGQAGTNPISLDAIQEVQLVVAPYDVRFGGFTGGGVNAVTRSGSNAFHGGGYYFYRNNDLVGDGPLEKPLADFSNKQFGASVGGPIMKDKAFFFVTGEKTKRSAPSGFSVGGTGVDFGSQALVQQIADILTTKYGFNPGGLEEFTYNRDSDKVFARLDFNLAKGHQLTIRHNYVKASDDNFGSLSATTYSLPNTSYEFASKTNSTVAQLNSTLGGRRYNELRLVYTRIRDARQTPQRFPAVQVFLPNGTSVLAGTEVSSHANTLDQDSFELTDDFTFYAGNHALTVGTHNEFFKFSNLFTQALYGQYVFNSVDFLNQGLAQGYTHNFSRTSDPLERAEFSVKQWGFYIGDQWKARRNLTVTLGARVDLPRFSDVPLANPRTDQLFGFKTDVVPSPTQFSPRLGFNWNVTGDSKNQVRGGLGVFTGRTPYVWLSNQFSGTGIQFARLSITRNAANRIAFVTDPDAQPTQIGSAGGSASNEYALVDPDFKFPSVLRYDVAYDRDLGWGGLIATAEFLYADTLQEILYKNVNLTPTGGTAFDGRPTFKRVDAGTGAAYLLSNTGEGRSWTTTFKVERPFRNNLYWSASYLYNDTTAVNDGTSSTAASQFGNNPVPGSPNDPPTTLSNYSTGHRVNFALAYTFKMFKGIDATVSGFYNGQSGLPFKYIFATNNDINTDASVGTAGNVNDLLYVPKSEDEVVVTGGTWADLDAFIEGDPGLRKFRGQIVERNSTRLPWRNRVDFRLAFGIPAGKAKVELIADVENFLNLFGKDNGKTYDETFPGVAPIRLNGTQGGKPVYQLLFTSPTFNKGTFVDLASRWQAQIGARIRF
jgi:Carboxypeptidase regulatory-like domain